MFPVELQQLGPQELGIVWSDKHHSTYSVRNLRLQCRCATCVDEWTRERKVKPENIDPNIRPKLIESVGRYALTFQWNDGHSTGIYTFDFLRSLCECAICKKN